VERFLPWSRTARLVARAVLAVLCFVIAIVLTVAPGPAFVFWIAGFVLLGFSVGQILLSVHAVQEWVRPRVPYGDRLPRLRKHQIRRMMRHRWVRVIDSFSGHREKRARRRGARRDAAHARVARREGQGR
jgi:polyferredoxin